MDVALFDILKEEEEYTPASIISRLYKPANPNAYHTLRKRLTGNLADFILWRHRENDL